MAEPFHLSPTLSPARRRWLGLATGLALGWAAGLSGCDRLGTGGSATKFKAVDITGAEYAKDFSLPDVDGKTRTLADFKGQVVVVFFGYTQCPDVCPTTMAELAEVKRSLGAEGAKVTGIFITVDPARDTAALLKAYTANFGPDIVGLVGTSDQIKDTAKAFKVFYNKVPGKTDTSYTVDHTAGSYVFDQQGRVRLFTRYGTGTQALADDLRLLLAEKG